MLHAHVIRSGRLVPLAEGEPLSDAVWIDLYRPQPEQEAAVAALGVAVPTLAEMEEIEISNRLYRDGATDYLTVVLPGLTPEGLRLSGPVTFIVAPDRLVTVRHHAPQPFRTFPERADRSTAGCETHLRLFLGLCEEIVSRLADLLEGSGRSLDGIAGKVFAPEAEAGTGALQEALTAIGREGEAIARVRLSLLTMERMLSTFGLWVEDRPDGRSLRPLVKTLMRDLQALEEHVDFLGSRVGLITDATLGLISLGQNVTIKIVSVVAALFLPPTVIASIYGMNFEVMPELGWVWGYPAALVLMLTSALVTYLYFKWKGWM